jgi:hypothetical protein
MGGVSVPVSVGVAEAGNVEVPVGGWANMGVPVAEEVTCVPGEPHENNNRHRTANAETKRVLDFIPHLREGRGGLYGQPDTCSMLEKSISRSGSW